MGRHMSTGRQACRLMISQHPEVEAKVLAELDALELLTTPARPQPRPMIYDDIARVAYTTCAIKVRSVHRHAWPRLAAAM